MSIQDELNEIGRTISQSDDTSELSQAVSRCETLFKNLTEAVASEGDASVRQHLEQMKERAEDEVRRARERLAEVKVARMDPLYEQHKAEKAAAEERKKMEDIQKAQQFFAGGGLGNLLGGLFGAAAAKGTPGAPPGPASSASPAAGATKCPKCSAPVGAAKFCPECGAPIPRERVCAGCQAKLPPNVKFCPECGHKAEQPTPA